MKRFLFAFIFSLIPLRCASLAGSLDNWVEYPLPLGAAAPTSIAFGNGAFVAVGNSTMITSANGADWSLVNAAPPAGIFYIQFVNGRFFAMPQFLSSIDGVNWTQIPVPGTPQAPLYPQTITYANGTYYAAAGSYPAMHMATSTDLSTWADLGPTTGFIRAMDSGNGAFVAVSTVDLSSGILYSPTATAWQGVSGSSAPADVIFRNGLFFTVRNAPWLVTGGFALEEAFVLSFSADGLHWQNAMGVRGPSPTRLSPRRVAAGAGYYVVPAGNAIYYNTDIQSVTNGSAGWTKVDLNLSATNGTSSDVAFGNGVFVAATYGKILRSGPLSGTEGIHFTKQPASIAVNTGGTAKFTVAVQGSDPITFQWRRNGTNLLGQTLNTLTLSNLTSAMAGNYDVQVTNPAGTFTSDTATLTVHFADMLLYAGLTLRGSVGDKFLVEYQDALNSSSPWQSLQTVTLSTTNYIYIDYDSPTQTNRYYRATFQP